jgi:multicomponent Na+:H+ antiporter subunit D
MLLHHLGSIDELKLLNKGSQAGSRGVLLMFLFLGISGVPPYGTFIGEAMIDAAGEELHYSWISYVFILAGLITAAAVLRVAGRIYFGWGGDLDKSQQEEGETDEGRETSGDRHVPPTMWLPALILLVLAIAICFVPHIRELADTAAARFSDRTAYQSEVLFHGSVPVYHPDRLDPLLPGVIRGLVTTVLALVLAGFVLFRQKALPRILDFSAGFTVLLKPLRIIHSGHIGDYVAWLTFGVAAIGGAFAFFVH